MIARRVDEDELDAENGKVDARAVRPEPMTSSYDEKAWKIERQLNW